jgi:hypothetical protein
MGTNTYSVTMTLRQRVSNISVFLPFDGARRWPTIHHGRSVALAGPAAHARAMFSVDEISAEAIRRAFDERGELAAVVELRRLFPGIVDNEQAALCARTIASWEPLPALKPPKCRTRSSTR